MTATATGEPSDDPVLKQVVERFVERSGSAWGQWPTCRFRPEIRRTFTGVAMEEFCATWTLRWLTRPHQR
jgi:hypothetical protein